jgi:replicative DNA helicase
MEKEKAPLEFASILQRMRDVGTLEEAGGPAALSELFNYNPTSTNAEYYAKLVLDKYTLRKVIRVCTEHAEMAYEEQDDVGALLDNVEREVLAISQSRSRGEKWDLKAMVMAVIDEISRLKESKGRPTGLPTGLSNLDAITNGLRKSEMFVIAARPSMGKTALCMNIATHVCLRQGIPVAVFSLEMSAQQLVQRVVCSEASVDLEKVRKGFLSDLDFSALTEAGSSLINSKMYIDDSSALTIGELRGKARRLHAEKGIGAIFIDYLQLLRSNTKRAQENRQIEIAEISAGLKGLAKDLEIPIVVLAQLNRNPESRTGEAKGRPRMSDLRESGSIEQDADVIALLMRDRYYAETDEAKEKAGNKATLIIAKQRNGPTDDVKLAFLSEYGRFVDRIDAPEPEG